MDDMAHLTLDEDRVPAAGAAAQGRPLLGEPAAGGGAGGRRARRDRRLQRVAGEPAAARMRFRACAGVRATALRHQCHNA